MRIVYFDCFAGASGDMILGGLLDAGLAVDELTEGLRSLPLEAFHLETARVKRGPISATKVNVVIDAEEDGLPERRLTDVLDLIDQSDLPAEVAEQSVRVFTALAEAEAQVHGVEPDEVHFHEVGAIDALVDVTGSLLGLYLLGIDAVFASPLPPGGGTIWSRHGRLPVPAPATAALLARARAPFGRNPVEPCDHELVTPTGAAILTEVATFRRPPVFLERVGHGAGGVDPKEFPNVLRVWIGEAQQPVTTPFVQIETNLDNISAEQLGYALDRLFAAGALDAWFTPIQMKKNRPGTLVSAIAPEHLERDLTRVLLRETRTLGVRVRPFHRHEAEREMLALDSSLGEAEIKVKLIDGIVVDLNPEFESARALAEQNELPITFVYDRLRSEAEERWPYGAPLSDE